MKRAVVVGLFAFAVLSFVPLSHAQQLDPNQPWQNVQNMLNNLQQQANYWNNYQSNQAQQWYQWQQQNMFQQQYQQPWSTQWNYGYNPSNPYVITEPEVYAPQVYEPGGNVLLEPGDDDY